MNVLILGGGTVGQAALQVLHALGAKCTVMDINVGILRTLMNQYGGTIDTMFCNRETIASVLPEIDVVLNCVVAQGAHRVHDRPGDGALHGERLRDGGHQQRRPAPSRPSTRLPMRTPGN